MNEQQYSVSKILSTLRDAYDEGFKRGKEEAYREYGKREYLTDLFEFLQEGSKPVSEKEVKKLEEQK